MPVLVPGPASPQLAQRLAKACNYTVAKVSYRVFPDGESYVRVESNLKGETAIVVQSCPPPQDKRLMELLQLIDASLRAGSSKVFAIVPYFAYSRQDKVFLDYEALSSKIIAKIIEAIGANLLITVNIHSDLVLSYFEKIKALNLDAFPEVASYLTSYNLRKPLVLSPDRKRYPDAQRVARLINGEAAFLEKKRDLLSGAVTTEEKELTLEGRDIVIVDDIISTGGTLINAAKIVSRGNPSRIIAACIHGLYANNALEKLAAAGVSEVVSTDTIESPTSKISVARIIADTLKELTGG
ncbi:MAG: ribose-phosphate diphosphokinase [Candidatus Nezhaarchaeales archaeon]|nr:MAG: ribose-phosphate pyrophosphokinase [Candidatus Nezhaarchaeota archaeon WYZ-LMO8]